MFNKQPAHLVLLFLWLWLAVWFAAIPGATTGQWGGISTTAWFWITLASAVLHQFYVWFSWRGELYHHYLTRAFGPAAFAVHAILFTVLILSRLICLTILAAANTGTSTLPSITYWPLIAIFGFLAAATLYTVARYFTFTRALGADHFWPDRYREMGYERRGMFRFTDNPMYSTGLLILWLPGIILESKAALLAAALHHMYVWVHYATVERPDLRVIYETKMVPENK